MSLHDWVVHWYVRDGGCGVRATRFPREVISTSYARFRVMHLLSSLMIHIPPQATISLPHFPFFVLFNFVPLFWHFLTFGLPPAFKACTFYSFYLLQQLVCWFSSHSSRYLIFFFTMSSTTTSTLGMGDSDSSGSIGQPMVEHKVIPIGILHPRRFLCLTILLPDRCQIRGLTTNPPPFMKEIWVLLPPL